MSLPAPSARSRRRGAARKGPGGARLRLGVLVGMLWLALDPVSVSAGPVTIVAIGSSNTSGWGVGAENAYPARLETLLRQKGYGVRVVNSGIPFETTADMLERIDRSVPAGTRIVVIQPGGNDVRFFGSPEKRAANIGAMVARLCARGIAPIVYDPAFSPAELQWDWNHLNRKGHARVALDLLPQVTAILDQAAQAGRVPGRPQGGSPLPPGLPAGCGVQART